MPFFTNARRFIINGPSGEDGQPPPNPEEIERQAMLITQKALQASSSGLTMTTEQVGRIDDKEFMSVTAGSAKFAGYIGPMAATEQDFLEAELSKMRAQLKARDERKALRAAEEAKNGGKRDGRGGHNGGIGRGNGSGGFNGLPLSNGQQPAMLSPPGPFPPWMDPSMPPPPPGQYLPNLPGMGDIPPHMLGFPPMNGLPPFLPPMGPQGLPLFVPPVPLGDNGMAPGTFPSFGPGFPPFMPNGIDPNFVPPPLFHEQFGGYPPNNTAPVDSVDQVEGSDGAHESQSEEDRREGAAEPVQNSTTQSIPSPTNEPQGGLQQMVEPGQLSPPPKNKRRLSPLSGVFSRRSKPE